MNEMGTVSPAGRAVRRVRDAAAGAIAAAAVRWVPAERAVAAAGRALHGRVHAFDSLHRVMRDSLYERWSGRAVFRRMRLGPVEVWGDVAHFSFGTTYFQRGGYEPETVRAFAAALGPGGTFVDVGANHGFFTVLAAALVGGTGRVEAFEPNPVVAAALAEVLARNGVAGRVAVHPTALSDRAGSAELFVSLLAANDGLSSLVPTAPALEHGVVRSDATVTVPTETFDAFAARAGVGRVDLVKIDVEGAEALVVRGMERTLAERPPRRIVLETGRGSEAARLLADRGYAVCPLDVGAEGHGNYLFTDAG